MSKIVSIEVYRTDNLVKSAYAFSVREFHEERRKIIREMQKGDLALFSVLDMETGDDIMYGGYRKIAGSSKAN